MTRTKVLVAVLVIALIAESTVLLSLYLGMIYQKSNMRQASELLRGSYTAPYGVFNQPQLNDTEYSLNNTINGSWSVTITSMLVASGSNQMGSEAQVAFAPEYLSENLSIPTIIVQERGDGLLRVEYYAQNWKNTYGLVLYNATSPGWEAGENVTLSFSSYGPPAPVDPQVAPYPNGNLSIYLGNAPIVTNYPIAWADLTNFYLYGLVGSAFVSGALSITVYEVSYVR